MSTHTPHRKPQAHAATPGVMKRVNQFLPPEQIDGLAKLADKTGLPIAEHTRRALDQYLRRHKVLKARATAKPH